MQENIEIIKQIIEQYEKDIKADYLQNPCPHLKERADKIVLNKEKQISVLKNVFKIMESKETITKIFIVSEQWGADDGSCGQHSQVFKTEEKAREYMRQLIKDTEDMGYDMKEEDTDTYSAWKDGEYTFNHTDIVLEEKEVRE